VLLFLLVVVVGRYLAREPTDTGMNVIVIGSEKDRLRRLPSRSLRHRLLGFFSLRFLRTSLRPLANLSPVLVC